MSKSLIKNGLPERSAARAFLAISLCASMAAFGCTTNRNLGNGDPVVTPGTRNSPTSGTSAGSESEPVPPPMMSSYGGVQPRIARMSADQAAAIMAQQQPRVLILGPASPGNAGRPYTSDQMLPQQQSERRYSVNSTLYSKPTWVTTSGAGEPAGGDDGAADFLDTIGVVPPADGLTPAAIAASTVAASSMAAGTAPTVNGGTNVTNAAAPVIAPSGTAVTPTSNAVSAPTAFASVRTLSPAAASVVNPPASISGSPAVATANSSRTSTTTRTTTTSNATVSSTNAVVANPVRMLNANGRVMITNSGATRQQ